MHNLNTLCLGCQETAGLHSQQFHDDHHNRHVPREAVITQFTRALGSFLSRVSCVGLVALRKHQNQASSNLHNVELVVDTAFAAREASSSHIWRSADSKLLSCANLLRISTAELYIIDPQQKCFEVHPSFCLGEGAAAQPVPSPLWLGRVVFWRCAQQSRIPLICHPPKLAE